MARLSSGSRKSPTTNTEDGPETMRATIMYGAGDVRLENVPDPLIVAPTDAGPVASSIALSASTARPMGIAQCRTASPSR
jgi:hypothetical protein